MWLICTTKVHKTRTIVYLFSVFQPGDNPALRLKDDFVNENRVKFIQKKKQEESSIDDIEKEEGDKVPWKYFDEKTYVEGKALKPGEDAYGRFKFNQVASDKLKSNRDIPDTRTSL